MSDPGSVRAIVLTAHSRAEPKTGRSSMPQTTISSKSRRVGMSADLPGEGWRRPVAPETTKVLARAEGTRASTVTRVSIQPGWGAILRA